MNPEFWGMDKDEDISVEFVRRIGENIKKKRLEKKLSLEKLGLEIGLTRMQVHRIEKGYNIKLKTLLKIALALEVKAETLLGFDHKFKKDDLEKLLNSKENYRAKK